MAFAQTHAAISLALAVVLWVVQTIIYPAFSAIDPAQFQKWHEAYTGKIAKIVAPLIFLQAIGVAIRRGYLSETTPLWIAECALTVAAWMVTAMVSVPLHRSLQKARSEKAIQLLVRTNWVRTIAWSGTALCSWVAACSNH
ncbi:MAG: hypothetical protein RLZZ399_2035 [Verrucomicrobiota bacterium]|jgi:riboflavin transporter FmnP